MNLANLLSDVDYTILQGTLPEEVSDVCRDNRKVTRGCLFICIQGARFDTHEIASEIAAKGASILLVEREVLVPPEVTVIQVPSTRIAMAEIYAAYYGHPAEQMKLVGITGSKGKTTTCHMVQAILEAGGYKVGTIGTSGVYYDGKHFEVHNTTPDSYDLQKYLRDMADTGVEIAVLEVSSQAELLERVYGLTFAYSIFTNIAHGDHIGPSEHKDFADYLRCKSKLFGQTKVAFLNRDDEHWREIAADHDCEVFTYGTSAEADYRALLIEDTEVSGMPGLRLVTVGLDEHEYLLNRPGHFNALNALAAICVGKAFDVAGDLMGEALANLYIPGRLELIYVSDELKVCIDNAHNGFSLKHFFEAIPAYKPQRIVVVFGCGGDRQRDRRFEMGEISGSSADLSIVTSQHNHYESFASILKDIKVGLAKTRGAYVVIEDRREAIEYAIREAKAGDFIGITGLGRVKYQSVNGREIPFDDAATALEFLAKYGWTKADGQQ